MHMLCDDNRSDQPFCYRELDAIFLKVKKDTKEKLRMNVDDFAARLKEVLNEIVEKVNGRAMNLVASSEETAASIGVMKDITVSVERSLKQILENS